VERINTLSASASASASSLVISLGTESKDTERSSISISFSIGVDEGRLTNQKGEEAKAKPSSFESNSEYCCKALVGIRLEGTVAVLAIREIQVIEP